jgi:predicted amidohydrolase
MRLTVLQLAASWNDRGGVVARVDALLRTAPTDLVLLPEAALTGYVSPDLDFDLTPFAEASGGATEQALSQLAATHRCTLVGPSIQKHGHHVYNTMIAMGSDGAHVFTYAKRHPWHPELWATAGADAPPVVTVAGRKVTIAICYDVQFVDEDPQDALRAADVLLFPSAWVDQDGTRLPLLRDLAKRFELWIVNANWSEGVVGVAGQEDSCIVAPSGEIAALAGAGERRIDVVI